ncbi:hypothetical protein FB451DRAFT_1194529 [Mycena latifolia]|nr:hypothetical protein FB451DRAFT_1194529 [Mycena latifolia]
MHNQSGALLSDASVGVDGKSVSGSGAGQSTVRGKVVETSQPQLCHTASVFDAPGGKVPRFSTGLYADFSQTPDNEVTRLTVETSGSSSSDPSSISGLRPGSPVQGNDIELSQMQNQSAVLLSDAPVGAGGKSISGFRAGQSSPPSSSDAPVDKDSKSGSGAGPSNVAELSQTQDHQASDQAYMGF